MPKPKPKHIEWTEGNQYRGISVEESDVPKVLGIFKKHGMRSVHVDKRKVHISQDD